MSKLDTEKYRKLLLSEREEIHREIEQIEARIDDTEQAQGELADYDNHPADAGTNTFTKERDLAVRDSWRDHLGRVDEALGKIERGTYGTCDRCGREISKGRLDAMPDSIFCVQCQDIIEGS
ncbi:MAG: TraR/DksA C4-type zinc finger protein [Armatimonadota bacterium]